MLKKLSRCNIILIIPVFLVVLFMSCRTALAEENPFLFVTLDRVNFRTEPSLGADVISVLKAGTTVEIILNDEAEGWTNVIYNETAGYIKTEYIGTEEEYEASRIAKVELLSWQEAKRIFTVGVSAEVYDVRTGLTYYVRSFSNGLHADVEPVAKEDTAIMLRTYGGKWDWDPRPVWVSINGRTIAASINGMPHGGGVISGNDMNGQVCIHFKGSTTHNGNLSFAKDHQVAVDEAWYAASR